MKAVGTLIVKLASPAVLLWTTVWFTPAWILYVRLYEECELELRFGDPYLRYNAQAPFC